MLQRVGGSIGTAILAVVLQNGITANTPVAIAAAFAHTYWWVVAISVIALLPTDPAGRRSSAAPARPSSRPRSAAA